MTEDEAKTKWCPFALAHVGFQARQSVNRVQRTGLARTDCLCIASACMAWRRVVVVDPDNRGLHEMPLPMWHPTEGFCGLAGKLS